MICANISGNDCGPKESGSRSSSDSSKASRSSSRVLKSTSFKGKQNSGHKQSNPRNESDVSSDDEWKPTYLKQERKIDPEKVIEIKTAIEPLFGPVKELAEVSDYDDDENDEYDNWSVSSGENIDTEAMDLQILNSSSKEEKNTGAIKKSPLFSHNYIWKNKQADELINKLIEEFTCKNSLPLTRKKRRNNRAFKHQLSMIFSSVFFQVLDNCCDNIYEEVIKTMELKPVKSCKKVKARDVSCQTFVESCKKMKVKDVSCQTSVESCKKVNARDVSCQTSVESCKKVKTRDVSCQTCSLPVKSCEKVKGRDVSCQTCFMPVDNTSEVMSITLFFETVENFLWKIFWKIFDLKGLVLCTFIHTFQLICFYSIIILLLFLYFMGEYLVTEKPGVLVACILVYILLDLKT